MLRRKRPQSHRFQPKAMESVMASLTAAGIETRDIQNLQLLGEPALRLGRTMPSAKVHRL